MRLSRGLSPDFDGRLSGWYRRACSPLSRCQETLNLDAHRKRATVPVFSAPADSTSLSLLRCAVAPSVHLIHRFCCEYPIFLFLPTITSCVRVNALAGGEVDARRSGHIRTRLGLARRPPTPRNVYLAKRGEKCSCIFGIFTQQRALPLALFSLLTFGIVFILDPPLPHSRL
jgi:hypothetical protein